MSSITLAFVKIAAEAAVPASIWSFVLVGFAAQLIDGCLGMAYGVSSNTFLLSLGLPPATASAAVHVAEVGTTGISGLSHLWFKNIDAKLLRPLVITGVAGGVIGAYVLVNLPAEYIKPIVSVYLLAMGVRIIVRAIRERRATEEDRRRMNEKRRTDRRFLSVLGAVGGFCDAVGGGGWGPVVTTTLLANGHEGRYAVGTVNTAEFFVTLAQAVAFICTTSIITDHWKIILGLLGGGLVAAPLAAWLVSRIPRLKMLYIVGAVITLLSIRNIWLAVESFTR